ncbi:type VII secretion integral membrane protein EccD [Streptomyces sp. NPDC016566]|uniref:type VII secretion integral membrane protein EccD n=1 Tax=Streptomyces sp. NPDC016566 TaxID=3364967 RepID=UPI0036F5CC97
MSGSAVAGLCRLRFHAPEVGFELAVPADIPLADLLPTVIGYAGADMEETGIDHGGWILQRLGGEPLDEEATPASLDLHDGDALYVRPRRAALPPVHFDDIVDGVATGMQQRGDGWRPVWTHHLSLALALLALIAGIGALALPGPHPLRAVTAGVTGVLLLIGAASASRAVGDAGAGSALGVAAVPYLAMAGALLPTGSQGTDLIGARLLAASSAAAGGAVLAVAAVAASAPLYLAIGLLSVLGVATAALLMLGLPPEHAVALIAVWTVALGAFIPAVAFRLSGLQLPPLPRNAEELQENIEPFPATETLDRTTVAHGYLIAFYTTLGLVCVACITVLASGTGWPVHALTTALSLLLILHARTLGSVWQRLAVLLPGVYGLTVLTATLILSQSYGGRLLALSALLLLAAALSIAAWTLPGRRLLPYYGRACDILHTMTAVSLFPLALDIVGVYHMLRGIAG